MNEFQRIESLVTEAKDHDWINAYVIGPNNDGIWIDKQDGSEVHIYSREQAIALRDWLTKAIGDGNE